MWPLFIALLSALAPDHRRARARRAGNPDDRHRAVPVVLPPGIESMMAKAYVLGLTRRPFTVYDADWKLVCMLCAELPTIENGLARPETTPTANRASR